MVGHVLGKFIKVDGLVDGGTGEPLAVGLVALGLVLIDLVVQHKRIDLKFLMQKVLHNRPVSKSGASIAVKIC